MLKLRAAYVIFCQVDIRESCVSTKELGDIRQNPFVNLRVVSIERIALLHTYINVVSQPGNVKQKL